MADQSGQGQQLHRRRRRAARLQRRGRRERPAEAYPQRLAILDGRRQSRCRRCAPSSLRRGRADVVGHCLGLAPAAATRLSSMPRSWPLRPALGATSTPTRPAPPKRSTPPASGTERAPVRLEARAECADDIHRRWGCADRERNSAHGPGGSGGYLAFANPQSQNWVGDGYVVAEVNGISSIKQDAKVRTFVQSIWGTP